VRCFVGEAVANNQAELEYTAPNSSPYCPTILCQPAAGGGGVDGCFLFLWISVSGVIEGGV